MLSNCLLWGIATARGDVDIRCMGEPDAAIVRPGLASNRVRLTDPRLRRVLDSMDVCQSVLASFFVRAAAGQYDLDDPSQLIALLVRMAQNKLAGQARFHHRERRDAGQAGGLDGRDDRQHDPAFKEPQGQMHPPAVAQACLPCPTSDRFFSGGRVRTALAEQPCKGEESHV